LYNPIISDKGLLEPIVMKVTRWVLRREGGGDSSDLSYGWFNRMKNRLPEVIVFAGPNGSGKQP
jgi:hypothetical protein